MSARTDAPFELLLIEDNPGDARLIERYLQKADSTLLPDEIEATHETALESGVGRLDEEPFDILLLDLGLPESRGLETLDEVLTHTDGIPVIVLTGLQNQKTAVEAIQQGAQDYLTKDDLSPETLTRSIRYAIERRERQRTLRKRERELAAKNERLENFASVVSHDLRNPLNVAQGYVDIARTSDDPDEPLGYIDGALEQMDRLIDELLTLAREGETISETTPVCLESVAADAWENVVAESAALSVDAEATVDADRARLKQCFGNLFRNAVEHGGDDVSITIGSAPDGFYVEDDGGGIADGEKPDVFEYGYTTHADGMGFGLAIVKAIVESHDWEISVTDGERGGARFVFHTEAE